MFNKEFLKYVDRWPGFDLFYNLALQSAKDTDEKYPFLEIGTRLGGSTLFLMQAIIDSGKCNRPIITIDPYGNKIYKYNDEKSEYIYTDLMYSETMYRLSKFAYENKITHIHYKMTSEDFFKIVDIVKFWNSYNYNLDKFSFVYLDGDHSENTVELELKWFNNKIVSKGVLVLDDWEVHYNTTNFVIKNFLNNSNHNLGRMYRICK